MDGELGRAVALQGGFVFRWQALALGCTPQEIARLLRRGEWLRLRRGAYAPAALLATMSAEARHVLLLRAVAGNLDGTVVATGYSALAVHGVPLWGVDLSVVHVHRDAGRTSRREAGVSHHRGPIAAEDVQEVSGLL